MSLRTRKRASPTSVTKRSINVTKISASNSGLLRITTWHRQWILIIPVGGTGLGDPAVCGGKRLETRDLFPVLLSLGLISPNRGSAHLNVFFHPARDRS